MYKWAWWKDNRLLQVLANTYITITKNYVKLLQKKRKENKLKKKHGIYELSHELPNSLRLKILGNQEISGKSQNFKENIVLCPFNYPPPPPPPQKKKFNTSKKLLNTRKWIFLVVRYFTWKLKFVSNIFSMIVSGNNFVLLTCPRPIQTWFDSQIW